MRFTNLIIAASAAGLAHAAVRAQAKKRSSGFTWVGANESGAEWGTNIPGTEGTDYIWPNTTAIGILRDKGMNIFRIPFLMERLVPTEMTGTIDATYLASLKTTVEAVTESGAYAVLDPHNYGRYYGDIIESTTDFAAWWTTVANEFVDNDLVIFDTNNEYYGMEESLVVDLNQAAIDAIRATGATTQYIFAEGNSYTGAWTWTEINDDMKSLNDTEGKLIYEMHQYLDSDGSGTSSTCVNSTIGQNRIESATAWLKANDKLGFIGEFAGGVNDVCEEAVEGMLAYMYENSDVWMGAEWWAAGPWWGSSYIYGLEPDDGVAYPVYMPILEKYFPDSSTTAATTSAAAAAAAVSTTSTTAAEVAATSAADVAATTAAAAPSDVSAASATSEASVPSATSSTEAVAPQVTSSSTSTQQTSASAIAVSVPTTFATVPAAAATTSASASAASATGSDSGDDDDDCGDDDDDDDDSSSSSEETVGHYYQCGGIGWTGATACESPYTCTEQNAYYYQCI
ncbi:hypothetical protein ASPZODRAFT_66384 [Penicilliopsis zonata CBS 506.65]|uniref:cellulase n=1 Tax=Penicilliopsis zonata CBS 506.65 TaxID=1073090 RepID=A0A1L9SH90_9EURO|nr:hypothetical protein ASPZODRAFT_66384 [Penicilliopsis zonata CBS 506.65]OJJ46555.1 hypothetical protein ASPZODRAFT_66384 [Penicilliopsis zonata CBS 506.65]